MHKHTRIHHNNVSVLSLLRVVPEAAEVLRLWPAHDSSCLNLWSYIDSTGWSSSSSLLLSSLSDSSISLSSWVRSVSSWSPLCSWGFDGVAVGGPVGMGDVMLSLALFFFVVREGVPCPSSHNVDHP